MKLTHLFVSGALLANGGSALVKTFDTNNPTGAKRFAELEENRGQPYPDGVLVLPDFTPAKSYSLDWLAGWLQAKLLQIYDLEACDVEVVTVNDPREGFRLAVVPESVCYYKVLVNDEDVENDPGVKADTLSEALAVAERLSRQTENWYVGIDSIDSFHNGGNEIEYYYDEAKKPAQAPA